MKGIFFGIGFFGSVFFAPNADSTIGNGAIHPFTAFLTLMVVTGAWILSEADWL
jgi:hypothetical protein